MIHQISSSLPTFKTLTFKPGLNVLIAKKEQHASDRQTRNRAGKTSFVEIVHFLLGANVRSKSMFLLSALKNESFQMAFDLKNGRHSVMRSGRSHSDIHFSNPGGLKTQLPNND